MFKSFLWGGFECATGYNMHNQWMDKVAETQHGLFLREDYRRLAGLGIRTIREGIRWPLVNPENAKYDFSSIDEMLRAAEDCDVQLVYDLFHYGYPEDVDLFSQDFPGRFAEYCFQVGAHIFRNTEGVCFFTPVNEPSFLSWAAGDAGRFAPHQTGRGYELKVQLAKAAIKGIEALWASCPGARIVNVDPICRVVAPEDRPELADEAEGFNQAVFQTFDMLSGKLHPELGGSAKHLDIMGLNYYWTNQWELHQPDFCLGEDDPRYCRLSGLIEIAYERYAHPIVLTETAHVGDNRGAWIRTLVDEVEIALDNGIPLLGACFYPVLGMSEWHEPDQWTYLGLWDLQEEAGVLARVPHEPSMEALREAQARLEGVLSRSGRYFG